MSVIDTLNILLDVKDDIKTALEKKTENDVLVNFLGYADLIKNIPDAAFNDLRTNKLYNWMTFSDSVVDKEIFETFDYNDKTWMGEMFVNCKNLTISPNITTSPIRCDSMFEGCSSLTTVNLFDTSNCNWFTSMFNGCSSLTAVPKFNISKMYADNTGPVITRMFEGCSSLIKVDLNFNNLTGMDSTFYNCVNLTDLCEINCSKMTTTHNAFYNCKKLTNVGGFPNITCDLDLGYSPLLSNTSIKNIIDGLRHKIGSSPKLTLHIDVIDKLTNSQITDITDKNWTLAGK